MSGLGAIIDEVRSDAEKALAACDTEEEREATRAELVAEIEKLKEVFAAKGDEIAEATVAKETKEETTADERQQHLEHLKATTANVTNALDEVLARLHEQKEMGTVVD